MSGLFGGGTQKTETTVKLSPEQKALLGLAMPYATEFAKSGIQLPEGSGIVGFNPTQQASQGMALAAAGNQAKLAGGGGGFSDWLFSGDVLNPETNPGLRSAIEAGTRPIFEGLTEQALPAIRGEAISTGNFGSSRQGIAEGLASREASRAAGDVAGGIAYQGYQSGLDAMIKNLGLLPQTMSAQTGPAATVGAVGDVQQQLAQMLLSEARDRSMQEQLLPLNIGKELVGMVSGLPGATTASSTQMPSTNPLSALLGIASLGAGLFGGGGLFPIGSLFGAPTIY